MASEEDRSIGNRIKELFLGRLRMPEDRYVNYLGTILWGILLAGLGAALFSAIVNLWSAVDPTPPVAEPGQSAAEAAQASENAANENKDITFLWGAFDLDLNKTTGLLVLAILAGGLGAWVHASRTFMYWVGQRQLKTSFVWWYGFRIFSGAALALIVYLIIRAGLFGDQSATEDINAYGTAAFAGLVGLFSKQALTKLEELFDNLFRPSEEPSAPSNASRQRSPELDQGDPNGRQEP